MSATSIWHPSRGPFSGTTAPPIALRTRAGVRTRARHWLVGAVGLACLAAGAWWVTNSQAFDLRALRVTGNVRLSSGEVAEQAGLTAQTNVLWLSAGEVERRLQRNPWVQSARVSRTLPSTLIVSVTERAPVAVLSGRPAMLVAGDGTILGVAGRSERLPRIRVPGRPPIGSRLSPPPELRVAQGLPTGLRSFVVRVFVDRTGAIALDLRDGTRVLFGTASQARAKGRALQGVLSWGARHGVVARYIDVRVPAAPALRPRSGV